MIKDIIVTGAEGMVGSAVVDVLSGNRDFRVHPYSHSRIDITHDRSMRNILRGTDFWGWINCAAYTNVDLAETEVDKAMSINAFGPQLITTLCQAMGTRLMHFSTDMVFNDPNESGYNEDDIPPAGTLYSRYGETKLAGENAVLYGYPENGVVIRTSAVYGPTKGKNFPKSIIAGYERNKKLTVTEKEFVKPTYSIDIATTLLFLLNNWTELVTNKGHRVFHAVPAKSTSRYNQAKLIGCLMGFEDKVEPGDFKRKIEMNPYSILNNTLLPELPDWRESTKRYVDSLRLSL